MQGKQLFGDGLGHRVAVYVPSTRNVNEALGQSESAAYANRALRLLSELFGGATATPATGAWVSDDQLVTESVTEVYAFASELSNEALVTVRKFALDIKQELGQDAVAVEIDGKLFFV